MWNKNNIQQTISSKVLMVLYIHLSFRDSVLSQCCQVGQLLSSLYVTLWSTRTKQENTQVNKCFGKESLRTQKDDLAWDWFSQ
jgi:hypothetical protein